MKRRITTTLSAIVLTSLAATAQTNLKPSVIDPSWGYANGSGIELDMNNDGHLDLMSGGLDRAGKHPITNPLTGKEENTDYFISTKMWDPATKKFKDLPYNQLMILADRPTYVATDMNMDGIMNIVGFSHNPWFLEGLFTGKGDGTFDYQKLTFVDENGDETDFSLQAVTSADVADFNNDGLPDIVTVGYDGDTNGCAVLINKGNNKFQITNTELFDGAKLALVQVEAADFNKDGYPDFIISGNSDNTAFTNGYRLLCDIYQNLGVDGAGSFFATGLGEPFTGKIFPKANGAVGIADLDNDGKLDLFITGESAMGDDGIDKDNFEYKGHIYKNVSTTDAIDFKEIAQPNLPTTAIRVLNSVRNGARLIDWDGDGDYDLLIGGWIQALGTQTGFILSNDGKGSFTPVNRIFSGSETFFLTPDWDGDGVKDLIDLGQSWDGTFAATDEEKGREAKITLNPNKAPAAAVAPASAKATTKVDGDVTYVTLTWTAGAGALKNATYELYIKDAEGRNYNGCTSFVGGDKDGVRKTLRIGNMGTNTSVTLVLPKGKYTWGVQAINAAYDGSKFTTGNAFEVTKGSDPVTAINGVSTDNAKVEAIYTVGGARISTPAKGLNIVKFSDGTVKKVMVK